MRGAPKVVAALAAVAAATIAVSSPAQAELRPADLVVSFGSSSGKAIPSGEDRFILRFDPVRRAVAARSISRGGLVGGEHVAFKQKLRAYISNWRRAFDGEPREAVLAIPGAGALPLRVSRPRLNRKTGSIALVAERRSRLDGAFSDLRDRKTGAVPDSFENSSLRINDNGWYQVTAHMDAYNELGGCGESGYEGPNFECHGKGQPYATEPFKGHVGFGSTLGGAAFWATGTAYYWNPAGTAQFTASARLVGRQAWGWRSDKLTITGDSYFKQDTAGCTRKPVSGTDESLNGKPGGTVEVKLYENGSVYVNKGYTMELSGYLSEPFYTNTKCDS